MLCREIIIILTSREPTGFSPRGFCWAVIAVGSVGTQQYPAVPSGYKLYKGWFPGWASISYTVMSTYKRGGYVHMYVFSANRVTYIPVPDPSVHFTSSIQ